MSLRMFLLLSLVHEHSWAARACNGNMTSSILRQAFSEWVCAKQEIEGSEKKIYYAYYGP